MDGLPPYLSPDYIVETPNGRLTIRDAELIWRDAEVHGVVMTKRNEETGLLERVDPAKVERLTHPN